MASSLATASCVLIYSEWYEANQSIVNGTKSNRASMKRWRFPDFYLMLKGGTGQTSFHWFKESCHFYQHLVWCFSQLTAICIQDSPHQMTSTLMNMCIFYLNLFLKGHFLKRLLTVILEIATWLITYFTVGLLSLGCGWICIEWLIIRFGCKICGEPQIALSPQETL